MEVLLAPETKQLSKLSDKIFSADLDLALMHYASKIKVLSLDCFDTILWRKTATPIDVFYDLQNRPAFKSLGFTALLRATGETNARKQQIIKNGKSEVQLHDIYRANFPDLNQDLLNRLTEEEMAAEIEACYAFPPLIELILKAYSQGIKIVIVSDTYLRENQLKRLLSQTLPNDINAMIKTIFCSCEYGVSKRNGLFKHVLKKLNLPASSILHIGDNPIADFAAAKDLQLNALHLVHHEDSTTELLRLQAAAASFVEPSIRHTRALSSPFRGVLATNNVSTDKPECLIGYASIGPIMFSFAQFILNEVEQLKLTGKNPKVLFLLRDAYLPSLVCNVLAGKEIGKRVRISRFASYAASFRTEKDINLYLGEVLGTNRFHDMAKQLLIPDNISKPMVEDALSSSDPAYRFMELILHDKMQRLIFKNSAAYRARLKRHLENEAGIEKGDTLVFVDLGYSGTTQRQLEPVFCEEMGIEIVGRYLISLTVPNWHVSRRGLLDPGNCDDRAMRSLVTYIALLEQISTTNEKSVIDYDELGNPIFNESNLGKQQYAKLDSIQAECIRFAKDTVNFFNMTNLKISEQALRDIVMAEITRLLFIPTETEIKYLESFKFDLNLGTDDTFSIFDRAKGLEGLKRRGIFSLFMEKNSVSFRTNTPAELRAAGLELSLSLMMQHRYSLGFTMNDVSFRRETLDVIIIQGNDTTQATLSATLTHDGFFSLWVPVGTCQFQLGILFGRKYQWLEIESTELIRVQAFLTAFESQLTEDCSSNIHYEQMTNNGGKLFNCLSDTSLLALNPTPKTDQNNYLFRVVFRPIVKKSDLLQ
ncbi:MAG: HAD family hydrolase [Gammaproteobacteria bacterium]